MADNFGDARLEELKFLAELDRRWGVTESFTRGKRRDLVGATLNVGRANFYGACPDANYRKIGDAGSKLDPIAVYSPVIRLNRMWGQRDG